MNLSGNGLDYLSVFLGGMIVSFTPCVYPLLPISAGYIGVNSAGSRLKGFLLSLTYVTGVAFTYSALGLLASLTGTIFGLISSSPVIYLLVGILVVFFGLSMMDLFPVALPSLIKMPDFKKHSFISTFVLGLSSGLIASPCLTPVLGSILAYLATKKNVFYGTTLLFVFSYGMGLTLILAGTFSSFLACLPKQGRWALYIKRLGALLILSMGAYLISLGIRRM